MPKNILHTIDSSDPGGAETIFLELIRNLDKTQYNNHVILRSDSWIYHEATKLGLCPEVISMQGSFNLPYLFKLIKFVRREKINLIHSHLFGSNVYCSIVGILTRVPVISTFHGAVDSNPNEKMLRLKFSLINTGSKYIVFVSEYLKKYYQILAPIWKHKAITIYNGIDNKKFLISENGAPQEEIAYYSGDILTGSNGRRPIIGMIGSLYPVKGHSYLLQAARDVVKLFPEVIFLIVGSGTLLCKLQKETAKLGIQGHVFFLGFRTDIPRLLQVIDLFVLPSLSEGHPVAVLEAMAAGKPVIATRVGGVPEVVVDGETGFLVPAENPKALAERMILLLKEKALAGKMGTAGRLRVEKVFTINSMVEQYENLYQNCL